MIGFLIQAGKNLQTNLSLTLANSGFKIPLNVKNNPEVSKAFATLQTADVTNIVEKLKDVLDKVIPFPLNKIVVSDIQSIHSRIQQTFQSTINTGYTEMFLTTAIISVIGFIFVMFIKKIESKRALIVKESKSIKIEEQFEKD
jgi:hypothetical protein